MLDSYYIFRGGSWPTFVGGCLAESAGKAAEQAASQLRIKKTALYAVRIGADLTPNERRALGSRNGSPPLPPVGT